MAVQEQERALMPQDEEIVTEGRRPSGCLWGLLGAFGCLMIPLAFIIGLLLIGTLTLNSLTNGITAMFRPTVTINITGLVLERVQGLSQLTTARYNVTGYLDIQRDFPSLLDAIYGEGIVLQFVGHATAGVDLSQIGEGDITLNDGVLQIRLPAPQLQDCFLNEQGTVVVDENSAPLSGTTGGEDLQAEGRRLVVQRIRDIALEGGVLQDAATQAQATIETFFANAPLEGVNSVEVLVDAPDPNAPLPLSCQGSS